MDERIAQYLAAYRVDIITAAEAKLERPLSKSERVGIENLQSGMRLEGLHMAFSHASTSPEEVIEVLTQYATHQARGPVKPLT